MMFPASAGMNRVVSAGVGRRNNVPRERGDEPFVRRFIGLGRSMFPASAGMNRSLHFSDSLDKHVPRERGDEP